MENFKKIRPYILVILLFAFDSLISQASPATNELIRFHQDAIRDLTLQINKQPNDGNAYFNRGYSEMMLGLYEAALKDYNVAYELSLNLDALLGRQWAEFALGRHLDCIETGEKLLSSQPNNYYAELRVAESYYELKDYSNAFYHYSELIEAHGEEGYTVWRKGLSAYYAGNLIKAHSLFKKAYAISPSHPGIEYSFKNSNVFPYFVVNPEFTSSSFKGSDFLGKGERAGINVSVGLTEDWSFRAGYSRDQTQNLNSSKGVQNYLFDPLSLAYYKAYITPTTPPSTTPTSIPSYLTGTTNLYNLSNLISADVYVTNKYSFGTTYKLSDHYYIFGSGNYLAANSSYLNGGHTGQLGLSYTNYYTISVSASGISHPSSKGGQGNVSLTIPFLNNFYSTSTLSGQVMTVNDTAAHNQTAWLIWYSSLSSTLNYMEPGTIGRKYGFVQQELGFTSKHLFSALGGRIGNARNPLFGETWVYPGFDLKNGAYARVGLKWEGYTLQADFSRDYWLDSRNERPVSNTVKISIMGVF